jgi:hypothetical protein
MAQIRNSISSPLYSSFLQSQLAIQHPSPSRSLLSASQHEFLLATTASQTLHSNVDTTTNFHHYNHPSTQPMHMANILYPESYLRTPIYALPFPHPKWHVKPGTGEAYEVISPIWEEYDAEVGYRGSVGSVRDSVEGGAQVGDDENKSETMEMKRGKRRLESISEEEVSENVKRKRRGNV